MHSSFSATSLIWRAGLQTYSSACLNINFNELVKMATRAELMQRLSILPTQELLLLLKDETLLDIASQYFDSAIHQNVLPSLNAASAPSIPIQGKPPVCDKAKRPLNAFMAFRSEYSRDCEQDFDLTQNFQVIT